MMKTRHDQQGVTMLVVLVLLSAMLLGGLAFARLTEVSTLASGNTTYREASLQASEVGLNTVFQRIRADIVNEDGNLAGWYWATRQPDANNDGIPDVDFDAAPEVVVGNYRVRYVAERMCEVNVLTEPLRQCLVRQEPDPNSDRSGGASEDKLDPPNSRQFRVTIRVTGPKDTRTWVQSLITRG